MFFFLAYKNILDTMSSWTCRAGVWDNGDIV
jgi:hypothetical protein